MSKKVMKKSELKKIIQEQIESKDLNELFGKWGKSKWEKEGSAGLEDTIQQMRKNIQQALTHLLKLSQSLQSPMEEGERYKREPFTSSEIEKPVGATNHKMSGLNWDKEESNWDVRKRLQLAIMALKNALGPEAQSVGTPKVKSSQSGPARHVTRPTQQLEEQLKQIMQEAIEELKNQ